MKTTFFIAMSIVVAVLTSSSALAVLKIQTFETEPQYTEDDFDFNRTDEPGPPLEPGRYATREESNRTSTHRQSDHNISGLPIWNSGGWIQPIGRETFDDNLGPVGPNAANLNFNAIKTSVFTGLWVIDETNWGDVSTATFLTMDVKGSFAGSGGISVYVHGDGGTLWSWTAAATAEAVGANPGDVTEWTTLLIPINKPTMQDDNIPPAEANEEGAWADSDGVPYPGGGNWGVNGGFVDDAAMIASWDLTMSSVFAINVFGITPDTQIDNLGFVLPDVGTPGDFDGDLDVDGADFLAWQRGESPGPLSPSDLADWETNFGTPAATASIGAVPEPSAIGLALVAGCSLLCRWRNRKSVDYQEPLS